MFFYLKAFITSFFILIGSTWSLTYAIDKSNFIHKGAAEVRLNLTESEYIPYGLNAYIITLSLFDKPFENSTFKMNRVGNSYNLSVPLYTNEAIVGIAVESPHKRFAVGMIELNQDVPLIMTGNFNSDGTLSISKSNSIGINKYGLGDNQDNMSSELSDIIYRFISYRMGLDEREPKFQEDDYADWKTVRSKLDSLYQVQLEYALNGRSIPSEADNWLINNLKYFFAGNWLFNYRERAQKTFGIKCDVASAPLEYYTFLNDIDFSSILNHSPVFGPYYLFNKMLDQLPMEIQSIGEIPVESWEKELEGKLSVIMPKPEPFLVDLLAMTSYIQQIKEHNKPLTDIQIRIIINHFEPNMSSVILDANKSLVAELDSNTIVRNQADQDFSLELFLKENPNVPVIVDIWNTWCSPCLNAHQEIGSLMQDGIFTENIIRLNICDESSDLNEWAKIAPRIGGINIRISSNDMEALFTDYRLTGFPSYLFFDKRHELIDIQTGFSEDEYKDVLNKIVH